MDAVFAVKKLDFIKAQLATYGGEKKEYGERVMIRCPFHNDGTPSGSLSLSQTWPGSFRCYACGTKASWDELAPKLQLQPFKRGEPKEEYAVDLVAAATQYFEARENFRRDKFKFSPIPKNKKWRGLSTNLLIELGGQLCVKWSEGYQRWSSTKFIHLPVSINDEQVGFFRARMKKEKDQPSYLNAAGKWSRTHGLFPFDYSIQMMKALNSKSVVLVEGQRDALRLVANGIPAMCIFGTQSISTKKLQHLELAGVKRLVILMDGDEAGINASLKIEELANPMFDDVRVLKLWNMKGSPYREFSEYEDPTKAAKEAGVDPWDPGDCPQRILDRIKAQYF